ncbi:hypothetical protein [Hymenobacter nivis]|uniref:Uncharacterized protein n=1 Tax=Hymenobacter nivis TaxID=1850093 RepID=A0A2Z3GRF0_9BACT|nr:hypothetical protein [Hymenobacter nivis]AWM33926.1 hypothetical protein DDQ68_14690 [Hymenobacter nivis]
MMRDLPEAHAHFEPTTSAGFLQSATNQSATNAAPGQRPPTTGSTFFLYGYLVGEYTDTLLCGHPDLVY